MKIVASTKLARAQRSMNESRSYGQTSNTVFEKAETKPLENEDKKTLLVVASSDKGLCGGIHSGLSRYTRRFLEKRPNTDLVVLGEKSKAQLSRSNGRNIVLSFAGVGKDVPTFADAQAIADQISLLPTDYGDIQIIYNRFINATSYEVTPIEAFSEEAIANSRKILSFSTGSPMISVLIYLQLNSHNSRSTATSSQILENTPLPTLSFGPWQKVTPANNRQEGTQWT